MYIVVIVDSTLDPLVILGRALSAIIMCVLLKGCANDHIPDFHIISETASRPRLQCGYCFDLGELFTPYPYRVHGNL